jgi:hypothetical protein
MGKFWFSIQSVCLIAFLVLGSAGLISQETKLPELDIKLEQELTQ